MNRNRKVTIYDLAQLADASASTVSAVLNGSWQTRRIRESTAMRILALADEHGYSTNMQARGLRVARSGMVGMLVPVYENRFFASLSQSFEQQARARGFCPVVASTLREPGEELRVTQTLLAYSLDFLFIAGAMQPDVLGELCAAASVPHVFLDLPGSNAPSVVSDNYQGAARLTRELIDALPAGEQASRLYFVGGNPADNATELRVKAFRDVLAAQSLPADDEQIVLCGYSVHGSHEAFDALCSRLGRIPEGLFINSLTTFEGVLGHLVNVDASELERSAIGCYDYDPLATCLQFPVHFVRQDTESMIDAAYALIDAGERTPRSVIVPPELVSPRTMRYGRHGDLG